MMIPQWEEIHNDPCFIICFKFIYCFHYCFKYHLLLYVFNSFIAFRHALNAFITFIYIYYVFVIIPFPLCDSGMEILSGLGGLCKISMRH